MSKTDGRKDCMFIPKDAMCEPEKLAPEHMSYDENGTPGVRLLAVKRKHSEAKQKTQREEKAREATKKAPGNGPEDAPK